MNEQDMKKLIPLFLDDELETVERQSFEKYLADNPEFQAEIDAYAKTWEMLGELDEIEPQPNYMSRFWTRVSTETTWYQRLWENIQTGLAARKLAPALVTACVLVIVGTVVIRSQSNLNNQLATLQPEELEIIENIELVENYDIIENIEFFEDFEIIEQLDEFETSLNQGIYRVS